ncbi:MAG: sigma-54-dependent Fis family transcriptional regulator [Myxococcales bacterium]|nr:sigma-54-dependent Fis family transcriptional regulator [Myxococcales bacterium]
MTRAQIARVDGDEPLGPSIRLATRLSRGEAFAAVVDHGSTMRELTARIRRAAKSRASLLFRGEPGCGRRAMARLVHELSSRAEMTFVRLDCAAMSAQRLEAELFGVKRGAYVGAERDREGLLQAAHRGTLLLENVSEIGAGFQPKLQEFLSVGEFHRVGDRWGTRRVDVRMIATTGEALDDVVAKGRFRRDLCDRLSVISLDVPSLRRHPEDIPSLLEYFGDVLTEGRGITFDPAVFEVLLGYPWPGNVRELQNAVECGFVLGDGKRIQLEDLPVSIREFAGIDGVEIEVAERSGGRSSTTRSGSTQQGKGSRQLPARVLNLLA